MWRLLLSIFQKIPSKALPSLKERRRVNAWIYAIAAAILLIVTQLEDPNVERAVIRDLKTLCDKPSHATPSTEVLP